MVFMSKEPFWKNVETESTESKNDMFLVPETTISKWMEMVISNHFLCKELESSNWNNH